MKTTRKPLLSLALAASACLSGCAGDPNEYLRGLKNPASSGSDTLTGDVATQKAMMGAKIPLHKSSFYTSTAPNGMSCAGDAKKFYAFPAPGSGDLVNGESSIDLGETLRPAFVKGVALDLTDTAVDSLLNQSAACSLLSVTQSKPNKCAAFDLNPTDSAGLDLQSSLLLLGGSATSAEYSLKVSDASESTLQASWLDLIQDELLRRGSDARPGARLSAQAAYSEKNREVLYFGGATDTGFVADTWVFGTDTRRWSLKPTTVVPRTYLMNDRSQAVLAQISKAPPARANFGYFATHLADPTDATLEKLLIVGGVGSTTTGAISPLHESYVFNPTFGPVQIDAGSSNVGANELQEWVESYHTRRLSTLQTSTLFGRDSLLKPPGIFIASSSSIDIATDVITIPGHPYVDGDLVRLDKYETSSTIPTPITEGDTYTVTSRTSTSFKLTSGAIPVNLTTPGSGTILVSPVNIAGPLQGAFFSSSTEVKWLGGFAWAGNASGGLIGAYSALDSSRTASSEVNLDGSVPSLLAASSSNPLWKTPATASNLPRLGAYTLLPGLVASGEWEWIYFGGTNCKDYLWDSTLTNCTFSDMIYTIATSPAISVNHLAGSYPEFARAGMAAARGMDSIGRSIIVAYGGVTRPGQALTTSEAKTLLLVDLDNASQPYAFTPTGLAPAVANGQLVYSNVTGKFYLFGGIVVGGTSAANGETWQLEISPLTGSPDPFSATWTKLTPSCWPYCPAARRSHRMSEVNYEVGATGPAASPQSYGIFMEGGTADGFSTFADRWMFDPTANGGQGHWLNVNGFPARRLAAIAPYEVTLPSGVKQSRALMYGGETGMQASPYYYNSGSSSYLVPPTLADTEIFDFVQKNWNRAELYGRGYQSAVPTLSNFLGSQSSAAPMPNPLPPPLAGAMMVTRRKTASSMLSVPEIYMLGGRLKNGAFQPLTTEVWKFCPQSPGESTAPVDPNPVCNSDLQDAYAGRWLSKNTANLTGLGGASGSFMGAATHDSERDKIVVFGGYAPLGFVPSNKVTQTSSAQNGLLELDLATLEWSKVAACSWSSEPDARFGHSLTYDSNNKRLILTGGSALVDFGVPGAIPAIEDLWVAKYDTDNTCYTWTEVTLSPLVAGDSFATTLPALSGAAAVQIPNESYGSGSYLLQDNACVGTGPIASNDPGVNKSYTGGVAIDIDRSELGSTENLLLQLSYIPLARDQALPAGNPAASGDEPIFNVHLISTGMSRSALQSVFQPRSWEFFDSTQFPKVVNRLAVLSERDGQLHEEQLVIPLSQSGSIDRIRIERVSGSALLLDVSVQRMGAR